MEDFIKNLGLSEKEAKVYWALLEHGEMNISDIYRRTGINRMALYSLLPTMISDGYVSQHQRKKTKLFKAENPEKLELLFLRKKERFEKNIKKLKSIYKSKKQKPIVKFLEGQKGLDQVIEDTVLSVPKGSTVYRYSARKNGGTRLKNTNYYKVRDAKKIERKAITSEEKAGRKKSKLERFVRHIPKEVDLFDDDVSQFIYGNKVAFVDYENKLSFIIESEKIAKFQKKIFKLLYSKL